MEVGIWVKHDGKGIPSVLKQNINLRHARRYRDWNGDENYFTWTTIRSAGDYYWVHDGGNSDIMEYMIEDVEQKFFKVVLLTFDFARSWYQSGLNFFVHDTRSNVCAAIQRRNIELETETVARYEEELDKIVEHLTHLDLRLATVAGLTEQQRVVLCINIDEASIRYNRELLENKCVTINTKIEKIRNNCYGGNEISYRWDMEEVEVTPIANLFSDKED